MQLCQSTSNHFKLLAIRYFYNLFCLNTSILSTKAYLDETTRAEITSDSALVTSLTGVFLPICTDRTNCTSLIAMVSSYV